MADHGIEKHLAQRSALIEREKSSRHDHVFKQNMSPVAKTAATILSNIRKKELELFWTAPARTNPPHDLKEVMFPGMSFALSRDRMEQTTLWKIITAMPKGCLLHAHMEAMVDIDWMIDQALEIPGFYITSPEPLCCGPGSRWSEPFKFLYRPGAQDRDTEVNIWHSGYTPNKPVPVLNAARTYPGGVAAFRDWAVSRMTINEEEALEHHHGISDIWKKFTSCFAAIGGLFFTEPIFRRCIPRLLQQIHDDGIKYIEFRLGLVQPFYREGADDPEPDFTYFLECFQHEISKYKSTPAGSNFWGARMIWTAIRGFPLDAIKSSMEQCLSCKKAYPEFIAGFDFVGQEDAGKTLLELLPLTKWFQAECARLNLTIPFFFHAGECLGDGNSTDHNLYDAILLSPRRIGHAFSLYKHPLLIDLVKEKKLLIEMCPISHEVLRLTSNILMHPMPALQARGVPVSLNNDDPAVLGHGKNGLSHDFYQVLAGFENTGLAGLATMAEDSVRWAAFEDQSEEDWRGDVEMGANGDGTKARRLAEWRRAFEKWCGWVVKEFGKEFGTEGLENGNC
ncbi:uncharacterized protein BDV17DRAFT_20178 [Aspergillus undulatus]|uniref:uncharacterized protein n=1 Tax=Aspergillus undulatus TaxID=1810928 RepID=UPI003CCDC7CB